MKIRYNFGPNAGKTAHAERSQATQLLIDAGVIEEVQDSAPQKTGLQAHNPAAGAFVPHYVEPKWGIVQLPHSGRWALQLELLSSVTYWDGDPDLAEQMFRRAVPKEIIDRYRTLYRPVDKG